MVDEHGLTIKQRTFADAILAGAPQSEAVIKAGYRPGSRRNRDVLAYDLTKNANIREYVLAALDQNKINPGSVSLALSKALHCKDGENLAVHKVRLAAIKEANKMLGAYAPTTSNRLEVRANVGTESAAVLQFMADHRRKPTETERAELLERSTSCGVNGLVDDHKTDDALIIPKADSDQC